MYCLGNKKPNTTAASCGNCFLGIPSALKLFGKKLKLQKDNKKVKK